MLTNLCESCRRVGGECLLEKRLEEIWRSIITTSQERQLEDSEVQDLSMMIRGLFLTHPLYDKCAHSQELRIEYSDLTALAGL